MPRFDLEHDHDDFDDHDQDQDAPVTHEESIPFWPPPVSGKAIASLVFSVMICVPVLPSFLATLFGILGLREISRGWRSGRGIGLMGLIFGLLGMAGWLFLGAILFLGWEMHTSRSTNAKEVATEFMQELSAGKVDAALARTVQGTPKDPLTAAAKAMGGWGKFGSLKKILIRPIEAKKWGDYDFELTATAGFAKSDRDVEFKLIFDGSIYRIEQLKIGGKWAIGGGRWGD